VYVTVELAMLVKFGHNVGPLIYHAVTRLDNVRVVIKLVLLNLTR